MLCTRRGDVNEGGAPCTTLKEKVFFLEQITRPIPFKTMDLVVGK